MLESVLSAIFASVLVNGFILYLLKEWLATRLKSSIEAEYKKQHELFTRELDRKEKVELVSELLAEWIKVPAGENLEREYRTNLNKLSFQCTLWLPPKLSKELSLALQRNNDAKSIFDILLMARKELIDDQDIGTEHITYWGVDRETQKEQQQAS